MSNVVEKVVFTFNKFYYDCVKDLKNISEDIDKKIKKHHSVKNNDTDANILLVKKHLCVKSVVSSTVVGDLWANEAITNSFILKNTRISEVLALPNVSTDTSFKDVLASYVYIFALLINLFDRFATDSEDSADEFLELDVTGGGEDVAATENDNVLFMTVMNSIGAIQKKEDYMIYANDIFDDDVKQLLCNINGAWALKVPSVDAAGPKMPGMPGMPGMAGMMENTKIGSIAQEIANDIDLSGMNLSKPEDILNGENSAVIGDIVSKVSSKLQQKFDNGSMKQEDLLTEAMSFLNMFGKDNNMLSSIMKNMGANMGAGMTVDNNKVRTQNTKERLRKKLQDKERST